MSNDKQKESSMDMGSELQRAIVAARCAQAVTDWYSDRPRKEALASLSRAMSALQRVLGGHSPATGLDGFLRLLTQPDWLADGYGPLIIDNQPSFECQDRVAEAGHDPEAELVQRQIGVDARNRYRRLDDGDRQYRAFRRFLIEHPIANELSIVAGLGRSGLAFRDVFEPVPASHTLVDEGLLLPCPRCSWPMRISATEIRCDFRACVETGARYPRSAELAGVRADAPPLIDHYRLRRGVWRYTLLPGLAELALAKRLQAIDAEVVLWPYLDAWDLDVRLGDQHWRVDVKDWHDPAALWRQLSGLPADPEPMWVVLPDTHAWQIEFLRGQAADSHWRFDALSRFVARVKRAVA